MFNLTLPTCISQWPASASAPDHSRPVPGRLHLSYPSTLVCYDFHLPGCVWTHIYGDREDEYSRLFDMCCGSWNMTGNFSVYSSHLATLELILKVYAYLLAKWMVEKHTFLWTIFKLCSYSKQFSRYFFFLQIFMLILIYNQQLRF